MRSERPLSTTAEQNHLNNRLTRESLASIIEDEAQYETVNVPQLFSIKELPDIGLALLCVIYDRYPQQKSFLDDSLLRV